jgi:hypothetical protein
MADLEAWSAEAVRRTTQEQAAAAIALSDDDVSRMVHEAR